MLSDDDCFCISPLLTVGTVQFTSSAKGGKYVNLKEIFLFLRSYGYSDQQGTFIACPAMPSHLPWQIYRALDELHLIDQGAALATLPTAMLPTQARPGHITQGQGYISGCHGAS